MAYPSDNTPLPSYAGTALQGDIDHAGWHGTTNTDLDGVKTVLGINSGTSVLKNFTDGDFCAIKSETVDLTTAQTLTNKNLASVTNSTYGNSLYHQALINAGFTVNQRVYVSDATLATTVYGHDRWKAGAAGGDYTFTQLEQSTVITIKAGKTLIQVIEPKNVIGGTYTLSWTGTAQGRYKINNATPDGAYADSPIAITGQTAGTVMSVEFDDGTLSNVVLNSGTVALPFMPKSYEDELRACQRYCHVYGSSETYNLLGVARCASTTIATVSMYLPVEMRITPTLTATAGDWVVNSSIDVTAIVSSNLWSNNKVIRLACTVASGLTAGAAAEVSADGTANRKLILSAEL